MSEAHHGRLDAEERQVARRDDGRRRDRRSLRRSGALAAALSLLALFASGPIAAQGAGEPTVTVHVDDVEGAPGTEVSVFLRTYATRPLGQGQLCIVVRRPGPRRIARAEAPAPAAPAMVDEGTGDGLPFAAFLGGQVFSANGDAVADFFLTAGDDEQELRIDFASPSTTVNTSDLEPLARLDFRLRDDLAVGDVFEVELDLARSIALDGGGVPVTLGSAPGRLFVVEAGSRSGAGLLRFEQRTFPGAESEPFALVAVERVRGSDGEVSVEVATAAGSATPEADYLDRSEVLSWRNGELGSRTFSVPVLADRDAENTETVALALGTVGGGARLDPERAAAVLAIRDAPAPSAIARRGVLRVASARFLGVEGAGELLAVVERFGSDHGAVAVDFEVVDVSAEVGSDYLPASGTLAWADGESGPRTVRVELLDDERDEGLETAELLLVHARGGAALDAERSAATLELLDDDSPEISCVPGPFLACLQQGRFAVRASWRGQDSAGAAWAEPVSEASAWLWFFSPDNAELLVKVLDACALPGAPGFWVSVAAATPLDYTVFVVDLATGVSQEYAGAAGQLPRPLLDTETFRDCP